MVYNNNNNDYFIINLPSTGRTLHSALTDGDDSELGKEDTCRKSLAYSSNVSSSSSRLVLLSSSLALLELLGFVVSETLIHFPVAIL